MKRFCSWIVLLLEIPVAAAVFSLVYVGVRFAADWISAHWMIEALTGDINLGELIMVPLLRALLVGFASMSGKICPSRKGGRVWLLMVVSLLCGLFFVYCRIRGALPFETPFEVSKGMLTGAAVSLIANAWWCFLECRRLIKAKKRQKEAVKQVCVFCYRKPGETKLTPFAYIEGGPGLVHGGISPALPERGGGFDTQLFERMKAKVIGHEFSGSEILRYSLFALSGAYLDDKAMFADIVFIHEKEGSYTYTDMAHPKGDAKPQVMTMTVAEMRKARKVSFDFGGTKAPAAPVKPAAAKQPAAAVSKTAAARLPQTREELIHEIGEHTGYDIFQASHRLGIDLHDDYRNYEKLGIPQMQQMLQDLRTHVNR